MKINFASIFPHLYIRTKRGGDVPFTPKATQQKVIDEVERQYSAGTGVRIICLKARQLGQSTLGEAMGFAWVLTHPNQNAAVIAHNTRSTEHLFQMTKHFYDALTPAIRASYPHKYATRRELVLFHPEGGESRMHIMVAESVQGGRGLTLQYIHSSEAAQYPEPEETMIALGDSMPVGHPSMFFIESTAYGQGGWFHDQWHAAVAGDSDYVPIFLPWYEEPEYALEGQGRKLGKLAEDEKDLIHRGVTKDQLAWRRWKIRNVCGGDLRRFWRENPASPEEAFISSGMPAFSPDSLRACYDPRSAREGYIDEAVAGGAHFVQSSPSSLRAFKAPATGCEYYVGARTTPYTLGPCVAQVLNRRTCEQVAVYEGSCDPIAFARELLKIGKFYNEAILAPDVEELGYGVVDYIARSGYPRIFMHRLGDRIPGSSMSSTVLGWSSTFKRQGWSFSALMDMLGTGRITIHDEPTYDALRAAQIHEQSTGRTWEYSDPDGSGRVSDLVVALGIACVGIEVEPLPTRDPMGEFTGRTGPIRLMAPPPPWEEEPKEDFSDEWIAGIL